MARRVAASPASPEPRAVRRQVGEMLGRDFSAVRFHTGERAAAETGDGSHAVCTGSDVYFAPGRFRPDLPLGRALIAHELTHVAQQGAAPPVARHREEIDAFRADRPSGSLAAAGRALADPGPDGDLTPAPRGMRQRCITGCKSDEGEETGRTQDEAPPPKLPEPPAPAQVPSEPSEKPQPEPTTQPQEAPSTQSRPAPKPQPPTPSDQASPQALTARRIAGAATPDEPYKIIRIAWTLDDGPTPATSEMKASVDDRPSTWFIMRNLLGTGKTLTKNLNDLKDLEAKGHEIAIHSSHPDKGHVAWFPVDVSSDVVKEYDDVSQAIAHLEQFTKLLRDNGLHPKFVRLPGGLISELQAYLKDKGVTERAKREKLARKIARQEGVSGESAGVQKVAADYDAIRTTLSNLKLRLWGGSASGPTISAHSWEAESSGSGLTDNVTSTFEGLVREFGTKKRIRSLIVLAHDTNQANAKEVADDVADMEDHAAKNGVQIQYMTVSALWKEVRGSNP